MWTEYALTAQQFKNLTPLISKGAKLADTTGLTLTTLMLLDSIDGRLLSAGYAVFWCPTTGRAGTLTVRSADDLTRKVELPLKAQPKSAEDLPPMLLGGVLQTALAQRAFVCLAQLPVSLQAAQLLVKGQVVADALALKAKSLKLQTLCIDGRRGFEDAPKTALDTLRPAKRKTSIMRALVEQAKDAASLNTKGFPALSANQSTASALQILHETLLGQMMSQTDGTQADLDIEFLHDLRVASRRARSLLQTMKGFLTQDAQDFGVEGYKWIGQQTTDLRDLDVYLADFPKLEAAVSVEMSSALEPFKAALKRQRVSALRRVRSMLKSQRFSGFIEQWAQQIASSDAYTPSAEVAPVFKAASTAIFKRYTRICRDGAAITKETPAEALHDLRKEGKKLRYLLEFFASLYPEEQVKPRIASLKKLQDLLGAYQDCAVQAEFLERKAVDLRGDAKVPAETLMAMGALADQRLQDEKRLREDFDQFFRPFSSESERKKYKTMTKSAKLSAEV